MRRGPERLLPLLLLPLLGCGRGDSLMPLDQGRSWTYSFYNGSQTFIEPVEVKGKAAVGSGQGAILTGPMGTSRLGWNGDTLLAARLANAGFSPAIPLIVEVGGKGEATRRWNGTIEAFGVKHEAFATMTQARARLARGGVKIDTLKSELVLQAREPGRPPTRIEVTTWFRPGVGIVQQEQRTNRRLIVALRLLD